MERKPDINRRKKLRIAMCVFFFFQMVACTLPFAQGVGYGKQFETASPLGLAFYLIGGEYTVFGLMCLLVLIVPMVGFLFCALDKERNIKNIVSLLCCFAGVYLVLLVSNRYPSLGTIVAILLYIILVFLASAAMVLRLSNEESAEADKNAEKDKKSEK